MSEECVSEICDRLEKAFDEQFGALEKNGDYRALSITEMEVLNNIKNKIVHLKDRIVKLHRVPYEKNNK